MTDLLDSLRALAEKATQGGLHSGEWQTYMRLATPQSILSLIEVVEAARTAAIELNLAQSLSEGNGKSGDEHDHAATEGNDPMMCYWCLVEHQINKAVEALAALDALSPTPPEGTESE